MANFNEGLKPANQKEVLEYVTKLDLEKVSRLRILMIIRI